MTGEVIQRIAPKGFFFSRASFRMVKPVTVGRYEIPSGFVTDGLSLPPLVRGIYDPMGRGFRAALLHDYLLNRTGLPRQRCAHEFREQLKADGLPAYVRQHFFWAVRAWDHFKGNNNH